LQRRELEIVDCRRVLSHPEIAPEIGKYGLLDSPKQEHSKQFVETRPRIRIAITTSISLGLRYVDYLHDTNLTTP
jgi:hypothetical protein